MLTAHTLIHIHANANSLQGQELTGKQVFPHSKWCGKKSFLDHCCFMRKGLVLAPQQVPGTQSQLGALVGGRWKIKWKRSEWGLHSGPQALNMCSAADRGHLWLGIYLQCTQHFYGKMNGATCLTQASFHFYDHYHDTQCRCMLCVCVCVCIHYVAYHFISHSPSW